MTVGEPNGMGRAQEVAATACRLLSEEAGYMCADGGFLAAQARGRPKGDRCRARNVIASGRCRPSAALSGPPFFWSPLQGVEASAHRDLVGLAPRSRQFGYSPASTYSAAPITKQTFWPPNPNEFEMAWRTGASRATFGTQSTGRVGSGMS
jgi:hypothetical protein